MRPAAIRIASRVRSRRSPRGAWRDAAIAMDSATLGLVFLIVLAGFGGAFTLMVIGQRVRGHCLRGSCGGNGGCPDCPNRDRRM
jgi:hypothetical protein